MATKFNINKGILFSTMYHFAEDNGMKCCIAEIMLDAAWIERNSDRAWVRMFSAHETGCGTNFEDCEFFLEHCMETSAKRAIIIHKGDNCYDFVEID